MDEFKTVFARLVVLTLVVAGLFANVARASDPAEEFLSLEGRDVRQERDAKLKLFNFEIRLQNLINQLSDAKSSPYQISSQTVIGTRDAMCFGACDKSMRTVSGTYYFISNSHRACQLFLGVDSDNHLRDAIDQCVNK